MRGPAATLVRFMNESRSIPTATSFRTLEVDTLEGRRKQLKAAGRKLSFTHLIAWAIVQAAREMPVMANAYAEAEGKPQRVVPDGVSLGLAVDVERPDGSRTLMVPVLKGADALSFEDFAARYDELVAGARNGTLGPDDYAGANITLTNPGGLGTVASVPRLMPGQGTIVATGAIAYPAGFSKADPVKLRELDVSKVMTMTSTYDHRVIQGAESGAFLRRIDELLHGESGFYDALFRSLGLDVWPVEAAAEPARGDGAGPVTAAEPAPSSVRPGITAEPDEALLQAVQAATSVVKAHRMHGHLAARLDPLGSQPEGDPALDPSMVNLTPELMQAIPASVLRVAVPGETFADALPHLQETYCGTIAYEIEHISDHEQRVWLRQTIESGEHRVPLPVEEKRGLLQRLTEVDVFEGYLHKAFLGRKQFSIEGLDMLVPMLDEGIELASLAGAREVVIGMAHRGRLNVLAHTVGRGYQAILVEFEGEQNLDAETAMPEGGTGDVKYHHGAAGTRRTRTGKGVTVTLSPNPSHLEFVDPVVEGRARADQSSRRSRELTHDPTVVVPVIIHGDAAFPGQGIVAETLNLQGLDGYSTGGTVHIITNNQLGFTTDPWEGRSTRYASDLAKGFDIPIIHVNADDVEGLHRGDPPCDGLPRDLRPRRADRPDRLSPLRPQRDRRAGLHAARDVRADQAAPAGPQALRGQADRGGADRRGHGRAAGRAREPAPRGRARGAQGLDRRGRLGRRARARPQRESGAQDERQRRNAALAERAAVARPRGLHGPSQAEAAARAPPAGARGRIDRLGPGGVARLGIAALPGRADPPHRAGQRARHLQPAPPRLP